MGEISPQMGAIYTHMGDNSPQMGEISPHMEDSSPHMEEISNHPPSPTCHQSVFASYKSGFWAPINVLLGNLCDNSRGSGLLKIAGVILLDL